MFALCLVLQDNTSRDFFLFLWTLVGEGTGAQHQALSALSHTDPSARFTLSIN